MNNKKNTIKDIAQMAGVSIGTVDRVIHNRGEVSKKTREKILKIIDAIDYQPDVIASMLASKKGIKICVLLPDADKESSFWQIPHIGIEKAMDEVSFYGVSVKKFLFSMSNKESFCSEANRAIDENPDVLLMVPSFQFEAKKIIQVCNQKSIPYAFFNSSVKDADPFCYVGQDAAQSGMVGAKLLDFGLKPGSKIIVVSILSFLKENFHILARKQGFTDYFNSHPERKMEIIEIGIESMNIADVYQALKNGLTMHPETSGIFVTNSRVFQIARFLEANNYTDIKLIGYDLTSENIPYLQNDIISFLINQKPVEQAYKAIMAIFKKIVLKKKIQKEILLPIEIVTKENLKYYEEY